ncbi:MAG: hypothetical protein ABWY78_05430 [Microvirga sp.]
MKLFALTLIAALSAGPLHAADEISLVGTWVGARERLARDDGYRNGTATLVVTGQKGRTFTGTLDRANPNGDVTENLWGSFTPNGRLIVGADEEGYYSFDLIDIDTLDYCYAEAGPSPRAVCARLIRQK